MALTETRDGTAPQIEWPFNKVSANSAEHGRVYVTLTKKNMKHIWFSDMCEKCQIMWKICSMAGEFKVSHSSSCDNRVLMTSFFLPACGLLWWRRACGYCWYPREGRHEAGNAILLSGLSKKTTYFCEVFPGNRCPTAATINMVSIEAGMQNESTPSQIGTHRTLILPRKDKHIT